MKTNHAWKRILAFTFALVISVSAMPVLAGAAEETADVPGMSDQASDMPMDAGTCGESATYTLDADGTLRIAGTGAVNEHAFSYGYYDSCRKIRRVVVAEGITELGDYAFYGCPSLDVMELPSTLTKIGTNTLRSSFLSDLYFAAEPEKLTWEGTSGLSIYGRTRCHVPADLLDRYKAQFSDKADIFVMDLASGACGEHATYSLATDGVLRISGEGAIDSGAFRADTFAYADQIKEIWMDDEITEIGDEAFAGYSSVTEIELPMNLERIGSRAFYGCSAVSTMWFDDKVTYIGEDAFKGCNALKYLDMLANPENLVWLDAGSDDFMPDKQTICCVEPDCREEFQEKFASHNVQFTSNLDQGSCGEHANFILDSEGILTISGTGSVDPGFFSAKNYPYARSIDWIFFEEGITGIGEGAFDGCEWMSGFDLPESMETIGKNAFRGCTSLDYVYVKADAANMTWEAFDAGAFREDDDMSPIIFYVPEDSLEPYTERFSNSFLDVRFILDEGDLGDDLSYELDNKYTLSLIGEGNVPDHAFKDYAYADRVEELIFDVDSDIPVIGADAFRDFTALKSVVFETYQLKEIGSCAFCGCTSLTSLSFKYRLKTIGSEAFRDCTSLQKVYLQDRVTDIGENAFAGCTAMTDLYIESIPEKLTWENPGADAFLPGNKTLCHVKPVLLQRYQDKFSTMNLTFVDYLDKGSCGSDSTYILNSDYSLHISGTGAVQADAFSRNNFHFCRSVESVKIGEGVTSVASNAFSASTMDTLILPSTLTEIQDHAFAGTSSLEDVYCFADPTKLVVGTDNFTTQPVFHVQPSMLALYQKNFPDWELVGDLAEEPVTLHASAIGHGTVICKNADRTVLQEGASVTQTIPLHDGVILEAKPEPGWVFDCWETAEHRLSYSYHVEVFVNGLASQDLVAVFRKVNVPVLDDETLTQWAVVDYEKKNGTAVTAQITARSTDAYEITLTNADGAVMDVYTVDPHSAVGINQTNAEINLPQTGVTSPGAFAAAAGAFAAVTIGAAVMLGSGVFRRRKDDSEPQSDD